MRRPNLFVLLLCRFQTLLELVNASARIHEFLLARKEGMALRTDFYSYLFFRRTGSDLVTAHTLDNRINVFGMNTFSHTYAPPNRSELVTC